MAYSPALKGEILAAQAEPDFASVSVFAVHQESV